jgi:hypothetical protein
MAWFSRSTTSSAPSQFELDEVRDMVQEVQTAAQVTDRPPELGQVTDDIGILILEQYRVAEAIAAARQSASNATIEDFLAHGE